MFRVGQKVVCVESFNGLNKYGMKTHSVELPQVGEIYEIDGFTPDIGFLILVGFNRIHPVTGVRESFNPVKFRPIDEQFGERIASEIEEEINQEELVKV